MSIKTKLAGVALTFLSGVALAGNITNGDFGTGNFTGWTATSNASVVSYGSGHAADLFAGLGENVYTTVSQTFDLTAGQTLTGWAKWLGHDYLPFNDNGFVSVNNTDLFTGSIGQYGNYGSSPVTDFSYTALTGGLYTLTIGVANEGDNSVNSEILAGGFAVPEPSSIALLGLDLFGFVASRKRKQA